MALELLKTLIEKASITPQDAGCQNLIAERLQQAGFVIHHLPFAEVTNLWAIRGHTEPLFVFLGHTDVVPTGDVSFWSSPPFTPTIRGNLLFGRGAADMKGSIAAMIVATERFIQKHPNHKGSIAFLITSDEEGPALQGTKKVIEHVENLIKDRQCLKINYCLVGEPTSDHKLADNIKYGRRGSLHGKLTIFGKQGHVAYPERALNPIHQAINFLYDLLNHSWDLDNGHFQKTTLQFSNIEAGAGAQNVIPNTLTCHFNFRFGTQSNPEKLKRQFEQYLKKHNIIYELNWNLSCLPFICPKGHLEKTVREVIYEVLGYYPKLTTDGGTSDARFIAPSGAEIIELGPLNVSIHAIDECIAISDLEHLTQIYEKILEKILADVPIKASTIS